MQDHHLQPLIRQKLVDGRLPRTVSRGSGVGPGNGETCDACEDLVTKDELVIEGISLASGRKALQLHVACFHLWDIERYARAAERPFQPHVEEGPEPRAR